MEESEKRMRREDEKKRKGVTGGMYLKYAICSQSVLEEYEWGRIRAIERREGKREKQ